MKKFFIISALCCLTACSSSSSKAEDDPVDQPKNVYYNPVINYSLPDPSVIKGEDGYFYLYATENIRNLPIHRSKNLVDWEYVGTAFTNDTRPDFEPKGGLWAPDINKIGDKYVLYYSMSVWGGEAAQLELNAMEPVMAQCDFESAELLMNGFDTLRTLCVDGITANRERCADYVKNSIGVVTALNPIIGYKNSTKIAKEALATGRGVYDLVLEHGILSKEELDTILKPENMIRPVKLNIKPRK